MRNFLELVVKKPVSVFMGMVAVLILGFVSLTKLSVDFLPDMELPYITVQTKYENAGPEEVEKSVTRIIENSVATVSGIKTITSTSKEGQSTVSVEFNWGVDLASATADIREAIDSAKNSLPGHLIVRLNQFNGMEKLIKLQTRLNQSKIFQQVV